MSTRSWRDQVRLQAPPYSSVNAPIHKFRWVYIPGSFHQGITPFFGPYEYRVTPRYFDDDRSLLPLDSTKTAAVVVQVGPFKKGKLEVAPHSWTAFPVS